MDEEKIFEQMAKEYSEIKPYTLQSAPFTGETTHESAIKPLVKLYTIYTSIDETVKGLLGICSKKELMLLCLHISSKIVNNITTILKIDQLPRMGECIKGDYSSIVRGLLLKSADGLASSLEYKKGIPYLTERLCFDDILTLYSILLTLTAF